MLGVDDEDGEPLAMGGWRWRPDLDARFEGQRVAEVKRMFVPARFRRKGYAREVLDALERTAYADGVERLVLETGLMQPDAMGLYESAGYEPVVPFGHYAQSELVKCYGKDLRRD